jgi:hypothetical protein
VLVVGHDGGNYRFGVLLSLSPSGGRVRMRGGEG